MAERASINHLHQTCYPTWMSWCPKVGASDRHPAWDLGWEPRIPTEEAPTSLAPTHPQGAKL
eukprot:8636372-Alexandrium_andersonii.AAC.1